MLKQYMSYIMRISIFIVLIELLIPSNKYKKYFDLCKGFVLIILIVNPLLSFMSKGLEINFSDMCFLERQDLMVDRNVLTNKQNETIFKIYKSKLYDKVVEILKEMDIKSEDINIHINKNKKSDQFGMIEKIVVNRKRGDDAKKIKEILSKKLDLKPEIICIR